MAAAEKIKIVLLEPCTKAVEDLLKAIVQKGQAEVERVSSSAEVVQLTAQYQPCMLVACLTENGQVPDRVSMLKKLETPLKKGMVKAMISTTLKNAQLANVIAALGVTDFIQEPVPLRTMQFKANLQIKAVENTRKAEERKRQGEEKIVFKKSDIAAREGPGGVGSNAKVRPALQLKEDAFLFKNSGVKKVGKKFVLEMEGPAPETGEWKQHEDKGNAQTSWRWVPNEEEKGKPDNGDGWVHTGDKPEFKEASGKWAMASEKPELAYQQNGQKVAKKVSTDENGEVNVAADSPAAAEAMEKNRALAQKTREKVRAKADAPRPDGAKKEKAEAASPADAGQEPEEEKKKENPALAMLARLNRGEKKSKSGADEFESPAAESVADPAAEEEEESSRDGTPLARAGREAPAKKAAISPLDFLKKKMEAAGKTAEAGNEADEAEAADAPGALGRQARKKAKLEKEPGESEAEAPEATAKGPSSSQKSLDALARMKSRLGTDDAEEEESPATENIDSPEAEAEDISEEAVSLRAEKRGRRAKGPGAEGGDEPEDLGAEKADKAAVATEAAEPRTRREVLAEIQARVSSPLPDEMPPEEEARLRKKFGLEGREEIKPKDLARKDRLDAIKRLKDLLEKNTGQADFEEEKAPEATLHDLSDDSTSSQSAGGLFSERPESLLRAFDSEDALLTEEESTAALAKKKREAAKDGADLYADNANYLPAKDLLPIGNAWEAAETHYVYLDSQVRYRGFDRLDDLLPLWIFNGDKIPELLDKTNQWRFYGPLPFAAKTLAEVPRDVRDFLLALRDQVKKDTPDSPAAAAERAAIEALDAKEEAAAIENAAAEKLGKPASQADGLEELFEKKKSRGSAQDALDQLKNRLGLDEASESQDLSAVSEARDEGEEYAAEEGMSPDSRKRQSLSEAPAAENSPEDFRENAAQSRLDALKNRLGTDEADAEASAAQAAEDESSESASAEEAERNTKGSAADFASPAAEPLAEGATYTDATIDKLKNASPSFEAFLERRKAKLAALASGAETTETKTAAAPPPATARAPVYLGIFVALSNSMNSSGGEAKAVARVLKSIELSFGDCEVAVLDQVDPDSELGYPVLFAVGETLTPGHRVKLKEGFSAPIRASEAGSESEILGYLFLKTSGARSEFAAGEKATILKAAEGLWPVIKTGQEKIAVKEEAA